MAWVDSERAELVRTLREADPLAPTLCEGWDVRRLLAHLVLREHAPWKMAADVLRRPKPGQEKNLGAEASAAATPHGYAALVDRFAAGPGRFSPFRADAANLVEYVVHHEDIRRGTGAAAPRELPAGQQQALWKQLGLMARMGYRSSPVGVELAVPGFGRRRVRAGDTPVLVSGNVVDLALHAMGRRAAANVSVEGSGESVRAFREWAGE
ncbi:MULTISPECIES: TIGR03085 family metal-binding protein [unclassified Arthrobacter]|uniref:TIGR03085 family metal-binding protein n=1 Tax=unclassified Arthrobacter TaxID=235627 RepID=UPI001D159C69|nr:MULTISPECIES: TIGR03085 family metal-binding protein [unclassified Arthrobacter]MCC3275202.1 TIGR03085 family protein [Arthrobacter sp. zg-Y20]MCC3278279.1 TIGR03085 family protein [Arthrobacter sp. zg-Y40]MCC9176649.1 TIGR03085 family metal-binding protein [Arthrobacter sp. zg-Y750]MDK1315359.1 TIGR03085 family metal-binding protein [Arthrobacter sp. zg.Y20]MDK1326648.1 TIGR03085 family metal-binding protein [Arthrobacter sp. zg-Y1143]